MSSLSLNVANSGTATYNLTSLGTQDWIVYPGSSPVRKSGGGSAISIGHVGSFTDSSASPTNDTATWSDGAGTTSGSTQNLIYSASGQGIGYSASFPADTSQRTATIIAGVYGTGLQVTASLSDGSAAQKVDTSLVWTSGGGVQALIQIAYSAASAGQTLNVSMVQTGGGTSNASFQAAAVTTGTAPTPTKVTVSPSAASGNVGSPVTLTIGTDVALTGSQNESVALSSDLAGSFSANPVSINASNPAITATFTPSAAGTATITGTPTGTPSIVAGTASYAANAQRVAVLYNDAAISYSPYNWDDRSGVKIANNTGAYARLAFTGTSINVGVDVSAMSASSLPAAQYPIVRTIIDGANFTDTQLTTGATSIPISGLANGAHTIEVLFLAAMTLTPDRWNTPVSAVRLTGFSLDNGASYSAPNARSKKMIYFGDSITEGYNSLGTTTTTPQGNSSLHTVVPSIAKALDAEFGQIGFGAQGYAQAGQGNVPAFNSAYSLYASGRSRLVGGVLSPAPDYVFIEHGANGTPTQSDVQTAITNLRAIAPSAKIFFIVPAGGFARTAITAAVQANASDKNLFLIDLGTGYQIGIDRTTSGANMFSLDGLHRNPLSNARVAAAYTQKVQATLDGMVVPATSARAFSLTLGDASGPAANLTGLSVAFYDQATPGSSAAPVYKTETGTTNASGVLTATVQSALAAGGIGRVEVRSAAGLHYNGPVVVS